MNNNFSVKNFRSYGETGASFNIAPITILTGCNSSGKSSLVKAQLLLSDVLKQIKEKKSLYGIELRVSDKNLQLGRFNKVLNKLIIITAI
jgi:AAA15 family ATPase/GTPase